VPARTLLALLVFAACTKEPAGVQLPEAVACGRAIDALALAQEKTDELAAAEYASFVTACLGTLVEAPCKPLAKADAAPDAMRACLVAYCPSLAAPKPALCTRPVSLPADVSLSSVEFALAAKRHDVREATHPEKYLAPYQAYLATLAYSKQRWGCGKADRVVRVQKDSVELFDGPSLQVVTSLVTDAGCPSVCVSVTPEVTLGRLEQVLSTLGPCGGQPQLAVAP
jgi:hypothetical protein